MIGDIVKHFGFIILSTLILSFILSSGLAQEVQNSRLIVTMSDEEISELDFRKGLYTVRRSELNVTSEKAADELLALVSEKLDEAGWSAEWQKQREGDVMHYVASFFAFGGGSLRLELTETSAENYNLLFFRF